MEKEGSELKENPLAAVAAPAEAITAGVVAANTPKEKSAAGADEASYFSSSAPLSPETDPVTPLMAEKEDDLRGNMPTPLDLVGANNTASKYKPPSLVFFAVGIFGDWQGWR